ncbi:hypothetical protein GGX14DRAFT_469051 [Mycena pura]|uniref:Uncharacterized protein n=1 Tax=Mycena pura TaxID=153505 RepID=A0AAD6UZC6_9AGAR|nr:hypothetical protein GGX14DRAFT_469051 [Mycena pura]
MRSHQTALVGVALALSTRFSTNASQIPFHVEEISSWDLSVPPNVNATENLVFDTVSAFLQHWPNTRYRNGHNLVPGIVPVGTLLYHGRTNSNLPDTLDWVATDPEHSYLFCRRSSEASCWHLTLVVSRPLQILYFDGSSAAKMNDGPMDSQDIVAWGEVLPDRYFDELQRIRDICDWGRPLGVDGYVRMEMDFEIMLCDFTSGVEVVSMANLASPEPGSPRTPSPAIFEVVQSGSWHNRYPGDRRIKLDLTRLVSFYDTVLVPSLIESRFSQERWDHRLLGISADDVTMVMERLREAYAAPPPKTSDVDWDTLFKVVVDRYGERLEMARYVLNATDADALAIAKKAVLQFRIMLTPYIFRTAVPSPDHGKENAWAAPVFKFCATAHTEYIRRNAELSAKLTPSEHLLLRAVEETNREICRVVVSMWAEGVIAGLDDALPVHTSGSAAPETDAAALIRRWTAALGDLMAWLDWSVWVKCRPECGVDGPHVQELCYLPTWPFRNGPGGGEGRHRPGGGGKGNGEVWPLTWPRSFV